MNARQVAVIVASALFIAACGSAKITKVDQSSYTGPPIKRIAVAPGGGALADAVAVELSNRGLEVLEPEQTSAIVGSAGISQFDITTPASYAVLRKAGADGLLIVQPVMASDGTPESASVRLISMANGQIVAGLTWQNGWGGMRGSIADRTMRENLADAASQIAKALMERLENMQ